MPTFESGCRKPSSWSFFSIHPWLKSNAHLWAIIRDRWERERETTAERSNWTPNPLQVALANTTGWSRALLWLPIPFLCVTPTQQRASQNSTVVPWPLQKKLFGPGVEGSVTAQLGRGCSMLGKMAFLVLNPQQHAEPFTTSNVCLMFEIRTEDSIWTSPATCRCMVTQMCWLLNTVELTCAASCSKGLWKRRIHSIYTLFKTPLFTVRICRKRVICTLNWIVQYRRHRRYDLFLWIKTVCTSQRRTRRVTKHTVYFVLHCSHIFQLPQLNS